LEINIQRELDKLERQIHGGNISQKAVTTREWGGADVVICTELDEQLKKWVKESRFVIRFQNIEPRRRVIITKYSKELSWLFNQLKCIFSEKIDCISKYDFYGLLAQSAINYLKDNKEKEDMKALLLVVLNTAKGLIQE